MKNLIQFAIITVSILLMSCTTLPIAQNDIILNSKSKKEDNSIDYYEQSLESSNEEEKLELLNKSIVNNNRLNDALFERGKIFYNDLNYELAKIDFIKLNEINPDDIYVLSYLGAMYSREGQFEAAYDYFTQAINNSKDEFWVYDNMAQLLLNMNEYKEALEYNNKALQSNSEDQIIRLHRAMIYWSLGNFDECINQCNSVLALNSENSSAYFYKAICNAYQGLFEEANSYLNEAIKKGFDIEDANDIYAFMYFEMGNYEEAIEYSLKEIKYSEQLFIDRVITQYELSKNMIESYRLLAMIYYANRDFDNAFKFYNKLLVLDSKYAGPLDDIFLNEIWTTKEIRILTELYNMQLKD